MSPFAPRRRRRHAAETVLRPLRLVCSSSMSFDADAAQGDTFSRLKNPITFPASLWRTWSRPVWTAGTTTEI